MGTISSFKPRVRTVLLAAAVGLGAGVPGTEADGPVASTERGWPQWRGIRRDGRSVESGLLQSWPAEGPKRLWTASGLGTGYSSPIVTRDRIYVTGDLGDELHIFALDLNGRKIWQTANGAAWTRNYPGARSSCTYSDGRLYHMNAHGRCVCLDAETGVELWAVDVLKRFEAANTQYGLSESVLVDGRRVYVTPGGTRAFMAALDARNGETVWAGEPLNDPRAEPVGNASPVLFQLGGRRYLVTLSRRSVVCVDAARGAIQWTYTKPSRHEDNCATPLVIGDTVFHSNPSGSGGMLLRMHTGESSLQAEKLWDCEVDNISGCFVKEGGFLYGSGQHNSGWACVALRDGTEMYDARVIARGSVIFADARLYCQSERGVMALVRPNPEDFDIVGRFDFKEDRRADAWAHPVICDARLYVRYHGSLHGYDIRAR